MWSAFMNGSGLSGGGGAGVQSQGWEFVPCSRVDRTDRGRSKSFSPLRRISSPPTVFSQIYETQLGPSPSEGDGGARTQIEILRGQMWPGPEPQQQQTQHARLKKKFEDLKKRHEQDKEEWMREKETLLREVADIQLEAREGSGLVSGRVQPAARPDPVVSQRSPEQHGENSTVRREQEEQRRLLADTHSTTMDLRCRLEHNERDWLREKAELLERFDVERREWESQLKDMQKKIEELYCEVRAKREGNGLDSGKQVDDDVVHRLSIRSTSTGSSLLSDNSRSEVLSSSSQSESNRHPRLPGFGCSRNMSGGGGRERRLPACFQADSLCEFNVGGHFTQNDHSQPELVDELRSRGTWQQAAVTDSKEAVDAVFLGAAGGGAPQRTDSNWNENSVHTGPQAAHLWAEQSYGSDKKTNTTALNAALKEIARVSEELCSYQDEIRKKSGDKRRLHDEAPCDLSQIYNDLQALEREKWINLSPDRPWQATRTQSESWRTSTTDPETQTSPGILSDIETAAPPIPPRTSSWNLSTPNQPDTELHIPDSPIMTVRKCHSPCVLVDKKCSSPSIVRKFEAMLQENEGKVLIDGVVASCPVPVNSNCNVGCCHNRWSCDTSKFSSSKLSAYGTVQKSFSEVNTLSAGKDLHSDYSPGVRKLKTPELQMSPVKEFPVDLLSSSLEVPPASPNLLGSRRNMTLEQKTAEFNRTLFQAEMGRGVEEQGRFAVTGATSVDYQPVLTASDNVLPTRETTFQPHCTDVTTSVMGMHPNVTSLFTLDSTVQNTEVKPMGKECGPESQGIRIKQEIPFELLPEQPLIRLREASTVSSQSPAHLSEVKHKVQTASSPPRKTQHRAVTEALSSEPLLPTNTQPGQSLEDSSSESENPDGAKPQPARMGVSLQQLCAENKQRQMTQPGHQTQPKHVSVPPSQSDSSRPGPRMMNDHPWKPLTLAAYPRPEGSRSNYGAVERILKNYESAARAQQNQSQQNEPVSSPNPGVRQDENITELDMLDMDPLPLPPTLRHTQMSHNLQSQTTHAQLSGHGAMGVKGIQLLVQENEESSFSSSSVQKNFSRPARPANRRLPSRWANRSPTCSSSSSSSSPSTTPIMPPSFPLQKHTSPFTYSHGFHIETVII
ncbi:uncharacterized protein KIAA0408-like isoform X2 [Mastacembelus armatus]|uniref:MTCL family member 3a n=1 Tax=Mastacembelus armatus TaxID=205130 RepID=A0A3Q3N7G1_9TELE|nr:uncharacterized protein KIAA0408-like isoform X2 [Mastacembelus armatus]